MPLALLLLTGIGAAATDVYVYRSGSESPDLTPRIGGVPAVPALGVIGILAALMGGSIMAPIGAGVAIGAILGGQNLKTAKEGLDSAVASRIAAMQQGGAGAPAPPALPGPAAQPAGFWGGAANFAMNLLQPQNAA